MSRENRRDFLRRVMTLAGAGLLFAGFGDYLFEDFSSQPSQSQQSGTSSISSSSENLLPDYQDFLAWMKSASTSIQQKSVNVSLEAEFMPLAVQARSLDFLRSSQINDAYSIKPYSLQLSEVSLMVKTQSPTYDVFAVDNQNLGIFKGAVISPFELSQKYPQLTYPKLNLDEFSRFVWDYVATYPPDTSLGSGGGTPANVALSPFDMPVMVVFYRSDIYSQLGMALPKTWDDYYQDVVALSKAGITRFGTVNMAGPDVSIVYEFANHLASFGAKLWEIDGNNLTPTINSPEVLAALENFVRFQPYSDPSSSVYTWGDVFTSLAHGASATGLLWHDYTNWLNDPTRSRVAGNIAMTANPAGPKGSFSTFGGSGLGVSRYSRNPEAAWLWLQWATAKGTQETLLLDKYHVYPSRQTVLDVQEVSSQVTGDAYAAASLAREIWTSGGVTALLAFPKWFQALDPISFHLNKAWLGAETPSEALNAAQQRVVALGSLTF